MTDSSNANHDERAIDALIVAALRADLHQVEDPACEDSDALTEEDRRTLNSMGPHFIADLLAGRSRASSSAKSRSQQELTTAMNRADDDTELTKAAREEMERRIRESRPTDDSEDDDLS